MNSQSSYVQSSSPGGFGRLVISVSDPMISEDLRKVQPVDSETGSGSIIQSAPVRTAPILVSDPVQVPTPIPTPDKVEKPITSAAVIEPTPVETSKRDNEQVSRISGQFRIEDDHVVIGGNRRIQKKTFYMAGGAVIGLAMLTSLIR